MLCCKGILTAIFFYELPAIVPAARIGRYEWFVSRYTKGSNAGVGSVRAAVLERFEHTERVERNTILTDCRPVRLI